MEKVMKNIIGISGQAGAGKDTIADIMKEHAFVKVSLADPLKRVARDVFDFTDEQLWGPSAMRNKPDKRYPREHTWEALESDHIIDNNLSCACCGQKTLKRMVEDDVYVPDTENIAPCYLTPRYALQLLGTQWGRHCYDNVWVDYALRTAGKLLTTGYSYSQQHGLILVKGRSVGITTMASTHSGVVIPDCRFRNEIDAVHAAGGKLIRVKREVAGLQGAAAQHASEREQQAIPDSEFDYIIDNNEGLEKLPEKVHAVLEMLRAEA